MPHGPETSDTPHAAGMIGAARRHRLGVLAADIATDTARITLIDALPGTGKTTLLELIAARTGAAIGRHAPDAPARACASGDGAAWLIDLPADARLDLDTVRGRVIVVAAAQQIHGYARLRVYGHLREIANADLFLAGDTAAPGFSNSCGWPALVAHFHARPDDRASVVAFLRDTVLPGLSDDARTAMQALARSGRGLRDAALPAGLRAALGWLRPLVALGSDGLWTLRGAGFAVMLREAARDTPDTPALHRVIEDAGDTPAAVQAALAAGHRRRALAVLERAGGMMLGHLQGPAEARAVLDAFGDDPAPGVAALRIMTAMKAGHSGHAGRLLDAACSGHARGRPDGTVQGAGKGIGKGTGSAVPALPPELRLIRLLMGIYSDRPLDTAFHSEYFALLAEVAPDTHLLRGAIYNVALDAQIRAGRQGEAQATARRALEHYRAAGAPYLAFYIHVHIALMHLLAGAPRAAEPELQGAERDLGATPFETPQDDRFLRLLHAQVAYEQGRPEAMAAFAETAFDDFAFGELWPSIASMALAFGAESLLLLRGTDAALRYLEGWRVQMWRTRRFRLMIEQREVLILQSARRWREARLKLDAMATRIGRIWVASAGENLADLRDPEDTAQALLWLRQSALERPRDRALADRLSHAARNPHLSWRQARCIALWQAWAARRRGKVAEARQLLADTLGACAARHCAAPVIEERVFVAPLLADPRMRGGPMTAAPVPAALRRGGPGTARDGLLSRQEARAMDLLAEGCSNKDIAREMAISLPTVKFHLRNIYAKLGARDRRAAVAEARARGLLGD